MTASQPTILLVDDDETTRYSMRRHLTKFALRGHVLEAADGEQALELVQLHCQACQDPRSLLVLLDLNMPVMDGLEFLERHMQLPDVCRQVTAVIVVSASPSKAERERARALAIEVRPKPINSDSLAELVRRYLPAALTKAE